MLLIGAWYELCDKFGNVSWTPIHYSQTNIFYYSFLNQLAAKDRNTVHNFCTDAWVMSWFHQKATPLTQLESTPSNRIVLLSLRTPNPHVGCLGRDEPMGSGQLHTVWWVRREDGRSELDLDLSNRLSLELPCSNILFLVWINSCFEGPKQNNHLQSKQPRTGFRELL